LKQENNILHRIKPRLIRLWRVEKIPTSAGAEELLLLLFSDWFIGQRLKFNRRFNLFKLGIFMNENGAGYNSRRNDPAVTRGKTICGLYFNCFFENKISDIYSFYWIREFGYSSYPMFFNLIKQERFFSCR
jgi:hypothetical protein